MGYFMEHITLENVIDRGLAVEGSFESTLMNGKTSSYPMTEPVKIRWKDRSIALPAMVVAETQDMLLGTLPLEGMDLIVDPVCKQLAGAHGDQPLHVLHYASCKGE
jgi:hypothetical protein